LKTSCVPQSFPLGSLGMAMITAKRSGGQPAQSKPSWLVETVWSRIQVRIRKFYERLDPNSGPLLAMLDWAWKRAGTRDRDGQVHIMLKRWALLGRSQNVFSKSPTLSYLHGALR
jgi:hypothetical protein